MHSIVQFAYAAFHLPLPFTNLCSACFFKIQTKIFDFLTLIPSVYVYTCEYLQTNSAIFVRDRCLLTFKNSKMCLFIKIKNRCKTLLWWEMKEQVFVSCSSYLCHFYVLFIFFIKCCFCFPVFQFIAGSMVTNQFTPGRCSR